MSYSLFMPCNLVREQFMNLGFHEPVNYVYIELHEPCRFLNYTHYPSIAIVEASKATPRIVAMKTQAIAW